MALTVRGKVANDDPRFRFLERPSFEGRSGRFLLLRFLLMVGSMVEVGVVNEWEIELKVRQ
jgi:hypothetical protein